MPVGESFLCSRPAIQRRELRARVATRCGREFAAMASRTPQGVAQGLRHGEREPPPRREAQIHHMSARADPPRRNTSPGTMAQREFMVHQRAARGDTFDAWIATAEARLAVDAVARAARDAVVCPPPAEDYSDSARSVSPVNSPGGLRIASGRRPWHEIEDSESSPTPTRAARAANKIGGATRERSEAYARGERVMAARSLVRRAERAERFRMSRCVALVPDTKRPRRLPPSTTPPRTHRRREPQSNCARSSNDGALDFARRGDLPPHLRWGSPLPPDDRDEAAPNTQANLVTLGSNWLITSR